MVVAPAPLAHAEFEGLWRRLPSTSARCRVSRAPPVEACVAHLGRRGFAVVASSVADGGARGRVFAAATGAHAAAAAAPPGGAPGGGALFLLEMALDYGRSELDLTFRCDDPTATAHFVGRLALSDIVGAHTPL